MQLPLTCCPYTSTCFRYLPARCFPALVDRFLMTASPPAKALDTRSAVVVSLRKGPRRPQTVPFYCCALHNAEVAIRRIENVPRKSNTIPESLKKCSASARNRVQPRPDSPLCGTQAKIVRVGHQIGQVCCRIAPTNGGWHLLLLT